jgi:hypothetical protein
MAPETLTTLVMVIVAAFLIGWAVRNLFGSWQPEVRRVTDEQRVEAEFQQAVRQMRRAIRAYERGR